MHLDVREDKCILIPFAHAMWRMRYAIHCFFLRRAMARTTPRTGTEYGQKLSPVPVRNILVIVPERPIQTVQRPKGRIDMGYLPGLPGFRSRMVWDTGPEQETNSGDIHCLFWWVVRAIARRVCCVSSTCPHTSDTI